MKLAIWEGSGQTQMSWYQGECSFHFINYLDNVPLYRKALTHQ